MGCVSNRVVFTLLVHYICYDVTLFRALDVLNRMYLGCGADLDAGQKFPLM